MNEIEVKKLPGTSKYAIFRDGKMMPDSAGEKKKVMRKAAELAHMTVKEFVRIQKK